MAIPEIGTVAGIHSTGSNFPTGFDEMNAERRRGYEDRLRARRQQLAELLREGTDKEVFNPHLVFKNLGVNIYAGEDHIRRILRDKERVEKLRLEYYLDHPDIKTNAAFVNYLNDQDD